MGKPVKSRWARKALMLGEKMEMIKAERQKTRSLKI